MRLKVDGSALDSGFSGDGVATVHFGSGDEYARAVAVDADGKVVLAGQSYQAGTTGWDFALARLNADGTPDNSFSGDGKTTTDFGTQSEEVFALAVTGNAIVVAGHVYNSNAAVTSPHQTKILQGLEREDLFTVVFDSVLTDTARYADVLLPNTTFLEGYDLVRGYGSISLRLGRPVVEPVGESRCNADVFGELLQRLELAVDGDPSGEIEEMLDVLSKLPEPAGGQVRESGAATPPWNGRPIQFVDVFPRTPDQKVDLCPDALDSATPAGLYGYQPDPATAEFPLALISPASERSITSTLAELPRPEVKLLMHPDDAAARELSDGDAVRVFNALGEVRCNVQLGAWIRPGTVSLPKGLWRKHTANGLTGNALAPDTLTDLGGGACFNDARVQVQAAPTTH
jgi:uncharacterized delta-60 repeat protein